MRRDPAKTLQMLDLLEEFFGRNGQHWTSGEYHDDKGNRCLLSAMVHIRSTEGLRGDCTAHYLRAAMYPDEKDTIANFNDEAESYLHIAALLLRARKLALADLEKSSQEAPGEPKPKLAA